MRNYKKTAEVTKQGENNKLKIMISKKNSFSNFT